MSYHHYSNRYTYCNSIIHIYPVFAILALSYTLSICMEINKILVLSNCCMCTSIYTSCFREYITTRKHDIRCSMDANSITICVRSFIVSHFFPQKNFVKRLFRAMRKHVDQSVQRIKREFDLRSETAQNAIGSEEVAKARGMDKKKTENTRSFGTPASYEFDNPFPGL